ncbi:MAG: tetratricopeptide repeat protein [Candidatus Latescibacterota bacterium]|nr:tetratricopeptide repeat protein [Candidatus Latescibacterota bacterium]
MTFVFSRLKIGVVVACLAAMTSAVSGALPDQEEPDESELSKAERHNNLGTHHAARGDFRQAAGAFRKAVELDPTMTVAHYNLGLSLARTRNHTDAAFAFQSALRLSPRYFDAWFQLGLSLMALENFGEAATAFEECLSLRNRAPTARFRLGQSYWMVEKWAAVIAQWDSLLFESPGHPSVELVRRELPRAFYNVGLDHQSSGNLEAAREAYEDALRLDAAYVPALSNLGILSEATGKYAEAVKLFERAIEADPDYRNARLGLAGAFLSLSRPTDAYLHYQEILRADDADVQAMKGLALSAIKMGNKEEALVWVGVASRKGSVVDALLLKAFVLEHNGKGVRYGSGYADQAAMSTYLEVIAVDSSRAEAHYNLGVIHAKAKRWTDAVSQFDQTLAVDSAHTGAKQANQEVERILKEQNTQILRAKIRKKKE